MKIINKIVDIVYSDFDLIFISLKYYFNSIFCVVLEFYSIIIFVLFIYKYKLVVFYGV